MRFFVAIAMHFRDKMKRYDRAAEYAVICVLKGLQGTQFPGMKNHTAGAKTGLKMRYRARQRAKRFEGFNGCHDCNI